MSGMADSVAKVPDGWLASNNRIERSTFPNQHCLEATDLESMLRARAPKIVLQHRVIPGSSQTKREMTSLPGRWRW